MRLTILKGCWGGGGRGGRGGRSKSASRTGLISNSCSSKAGNNVAITGSIVLLLVWSFVGDCWGKSFRAGGQAEIEEDTTQGNLKEKFSPGVGGSSSATGGAHSQLIDDSLLEDDGVDEEDNEDDLMVGNVNGLVQLGTQDVSPQRWGDYKTHRHLLGNYGAVVHKRSLGRSYAIDDGGGDEEYPLGFQRFASDNRPAYLKRSGSSGSGPIPAASSSQIRQKLMHLRNQYGDRWLSAFMGPYAKRQILYRQCFFNPISCF